MRQPSPRFLLLLVLALVASLAPAARADDRAEARMHYQTGVKLYSSSDYRGAIKEFTAAQQLAPADLNNYNLALCYDKLGEAESAIQYYRAYIDKAPTADKKAEIEASIARLEGALKSAATKRADEQKKADDAKAAEDARKADAAKQAQAHNDAGAGVGAAGAGVVVGAEVGVGAGSGVATGAGGSGTPGTGQVVPTGDAQLDRIAGINIDEIRDQRMGNPGSGMNAGAGMGMGANAGGGVGVGVNGSVNGSVQGGGAIGAGGAGGMYGNATATAGPNGMNPNGQQNPAGASPTDHAPPQEKPIYTKWWFWAIVVVGAYVVYEVADSSSNSANMGRELPTGPAARANTPSGLTLFRF